MAAVAKKGVEGMKLMGEERGLSLWMNQGRRQKKEGWQRNLNCQKICYNACVPETTMCEIRGGTKLHSPCEDIYQKHLEAAHTDVGREEGELNLQNQLPKTG